MVAITVNNKAIFNTRTERKIIACCACHQTTVIDFEVDCYTYTFYSNYKGCEIEDIGFDYYRLNGSERVAVKDGYVPHCPRCNAKQIERRSLKAKHSEKHVCGNDCQSATGATCVCSCNGVNHGISHRFNV